MPIIPTITHVLYNESTESLYACSQEFFQSVRVQGRNHTLLFLYDDTAITSNSYRLYRSGHYKLFLYLDHEVMMTYWGIARAGAQPAAAA